MRLFHRGRTIHAGNMAKSSSDRTVQKKQPAWGCSSLSHICQRTSRPCNDLQCRDSGLVQRDLWDVGAFPASVRLDARELHHLAPFLSLFDDELAEVAG